MHTGRLLGAGRPDRGAMAYFIDRIGDRVQDLIATKRFLPALSRALAALSLILRFLPMRGLSRRVCDGRMYIACQQRDRRKAAAILMDFARRETPGADSIRLFLYEVFAHVSPETARQLVKTVHFDTHIKPVIEAALLRRDCNLEAALQTLNYVAETAAARVHVAEYMRSLLLEERRHEDFAVDGFARLSQDADAPLFEFSVSVAAAADNAGRMDILRPVLQRIISHREAIIEDPERLAKFAQQAVEASLWCLDLDGVRRVIAALRKYSMEKAATRLERRVKIDELSPIAALIDQAHRDILVRAGLATPHTAACDAVLAIPSAAIRYNKIDYPGFRRDIRFVLRTVADTLDDLGVKYAVKGQIRLHGNEDLPVPFFSYHTVSPRGNGLHFKETDRPSRFSFDARGYSGWSDFSHRSSSQLPLAGVDRQLAARLFAEDQQQIIGRNISKYAQDPRRSGEALPEQFVFVALQMTGDSVQELASFTPIEMMEEVIRACGKLNRTVVVKRHPLCGSAVIGKYLLDNEAAGRIRLAGGSIHDIIARAEAVCVVNSGVGAEALLHEKPVYVFGRSDYMAACFVCAAPGDFERHFQPGRTALSSDDLRRFWYLFRNDYAVDLRDRDKAAAEIRARVQSHLASVREHYGPAATAL